MRRDRGRDGVLTRGAVLLGVVVIVVLLGVVLAAREAGPIPIDERALLAGNDDAPPPTSAPPAQQTNQQGSESEGLLAKVSMWYVIVSWLALALVVTIVLRALIAMRTDEEGDRVRTPAPGPDAAPWPGAMEQLQRAAARAEELLLAARPGNVGDAVIAAWMELERAATAAGSGRRPSATPTEFTVALLKRHDADADAMAALLAIYHRARFGGPALPAAAGDEALAAVRTIAAGLGVTRTGAR